MHLTQGTFSFLPPLTDDQIASQVQYCLDNGWAVSIEYTDDPHPRNTYWEMWGQPMFDLATVGPFMSELAACRAQHTNMYVRVAAFDSTKGWESLRTLFIVDRPEVEPGFAVERTPGPGRTMTYATRSYAADRPVGQRYP
jgi:ribulose-bisphosphate carboxylase small chain